MNYYSTYYSPIGKLYLVSDGAVLTGLFFDAEKILSNIERNAEKGSWKEIEGKKEPCFQQKSLPVLEKTKQWLDLYFQGREPDFFPELSFHDTPFREEVWELLKEIPYGKTVSYGDLAKKIAAHHGIKKMSAQALGGAVGKNPISIIIPCHRVIGADGSLVGYGGGMNRKKYLLELEGIQIIDKTDK